jgi:hypothetical protein
MTWANPTSLACLQEMAAILFLQQLIGYYFRALLSNK